MTRSRIVLDEFSGCLVFHAGFLGINLVFDYSVVSDDDELKFVEHEPNDDDDVEQHCQRDSDDHEPSTFILFFHFWQVAGTKMQL